MARRHLCPPWLCDCHCVTFAMPRFKRIQALTDNLNRAAHGLRVVRAYNENTIQEANRHKLPPTTCQPTGLTAIMFPGMNLVMDGLTLAIYWIGAPTSFGAISLTGGGAVSIQRAGCLFQHGGFLPRHGSGGSLHDAGDDLYHLAPVFVSGASGVLGRYWKPIPPSQTAPARKVFRPGGRGGIPECVLPLTARRRSVGEHVSFRAKRGTTRPSSGATRLRQIQPHQLDLGLMTPPKGRFWWMAWTCESIPWPPSTKKLGYVPRASVSGTIPPRGLGADHATKSAA